MKTFKEFEELKEATMGQWAIGGAALNGVNLAAQLTMFAGSMGAGVLLAPGLIAAGLMTGALMGLSGGVLFAGGKVRQTVKKLEKVSKKIDKEIDRMKAGKSTTMTILKDLIAEAEYLHGVLDNRANNKLMKSSGLLRKDIVLIDKYQIYLADNKKHIKLLKADVAKFMKGK